MVIPSWLQNVEFIGESVENTIITYDDHANINKMGTFRTYTVKVEGNSITFKNLTIENNAARLGQAVALHTEGDKLVFINCRILGNQDTIYTGAAGTRLYLQIAILMALLILYLVLLPHCLRIARYGVKPIHT